MVTAKKMRSKGVNEALTWVSEHPLPSVTDPIDAPAWELITRNLFHIANSPDPRVRGSMARATRAQKIILDRMVGRRRPGSHPIMTGSESITFVDLTVGVLERGEDE